MMPDSFREAYQPKRLILAITSGMIAAAVDIPLAISLAALIFSGSLSAYLGLGIGFFLAGAVIFGVIVALTSSLPASIAIPHDTAAVLVAILAAGIVSHLQPASNQEAGYASVLAAMILTSLLTGVVFLLLGVFKMGDLIRYIPYPVIGGFLAGTGWLLARGSVRVMTGLTIDLKTLEVLFQTDRLIEWLPGVVFGVIVLLCMRRYTHFLVIPGLVTGAITLIYLGLWLAGLGLDHARELGLLLGPFPSGGLWRPLSPALFGAVDWMAIRSQSGQLVTIILFCVVGLLLNASGLELASKREIDLNQELRANGLANLLAGLVGSPPGYISLSLSTFGLRLGSINRINGIVFAGVCAFTMLFGAPVLSYLPKWVVGGLLFYLGLSFLVEWLFNAWFRLSRLDYAIILVILATIAVLGPLQGVSLGVVLSAALFIFEYSKIRVVKHSLSSENYQSSVDRSPDEKAYLSKSGDWLRVMELQGYLFFGTANRLYEAVRRELKHMVEVQTRFISMDFRLVTGLDASAAISFAKMKQLVQPMGIVLVFTGLSEEVENKLVKIVLNPSEQEGWRTFNDLDHGIEWCENIMLSEMEQTTHESHSTEGSQARRQLEKLLHTSLKDHLEELIVDKGYVLIHQGDLPKGLFFIDQGQVTAQLEMPNGEKLRLRSMSDGNVVGEIGLYLNTPASASVIVDKPSVVYFLPGEKFRELAEEDPKAVAELHHFMVLLLGERVLNMMATLKALSS